MPRPLALLILSLGFFVTLAGLTACSSTSASQLRTDALQNRQNRMNSRAEDAATRRQIRSDNMDARTAATFDAM